MKQTRHRADTLPQSERLNSQAPYERPISVALPDTMRVMLVKIETRAAARKNISGNTLLNIVVTTGLLDTLQRQSLLYDQVHTHQAL